jgi:hypothetical protein
LASEGFNKKKSLPGCLQIFQRKKTKFLAHKKRPEIPSSNFENLEIQDTRNFSLKISIINKLSTFVAPNIER